MTLVSCSQAPRLTLMSRAANVAMLELMLSAQVSVGRNRGYDCRMSSMPAAPLSEPPVSLRRAAEAERIDAGRPRQSHRERVRASLAWALKEYADTLEKLAK